MLRYRFVCFSLLLAIWTSLASCGPDPTASPGSAPIATPAATFAPARGTNTPAVPVARPSPADGPAAVVTVAPDSAGRRMTVLLESFHFSPSSLTARVGQPIRLNLENSDALFHDFAIDNSDVTVSVPPRTSQTLDFVFTRLGVYTFACNLNSEGDHRSQGMLGTIVVAP